MTQFKQILGQCQRVGPHDVNVLHVGMDGCARIGDGCQRKLAPTPNYFLRTTTTTTLSSLEMSNINWHIYDLWKTNSGHGLRLEIHKSMVLDAPSPSHVFDSGIQSSIIQTLIFRNSGTVVMLHENDHQWSINGVHCHPKLTRRSFTIIQS